MSTNPFRRSSFKDAPDTANKNQPEPDGTVPVPLSVDTRGMLLCSNRLASTSLTAVLCSSQLLPEARQLCVSSCLSDLPRLVSFLTRVDEELARL